MKPHMKTVAVTGLSLLLGIVVAWSSAPADDSKTEAANAKRDRADRSKADRPERDKADRPDRDPQAREARRKADENRDASRERKPREDRSQRAAQRSSGKVERHGWVIRLNRESMEEYVKIHAETWPEILTLIRKCNIRNYSIYMDELDDGNLYLFAYFEYVGDDWEADMKIMDADPKMHEWWKLTDPMQMRVKGTPEGKQWKPMKEVFHTD